MTPTSQRLAGATPTASPDDGSYIPGVCNIGPAERARRLRSGHIGAIVSAVFLAGLIVAGAPTWTRLLVALPVAGAASGYLQAWLHFCAGFGSRGVFNFGAIGTTETAVDPEARRRDRLRAIQIGLGAVAIGIVVGVLAAILPL
jgi:hypothetical protein